MSDLRRLFYKPLFEYVSLNYENIDHKPKDLPEKHDTEAIPTEIETPTNLTSRQTTTPSFPQTIEGYISSNFVYPLDKTLSLLNRAAISNAIMNLHLLETISELQSYVFLKNSHFRQLLFHSIFEKVTTCLENNGKISHYMNTLTITNSMNRAFLAVYNGEQNYAKFLEFDIAVNDDVAFCQSAYQVIECLKTQFHVNQFDFFSKTRGDYLVVNDIMIKLAFVKYQLSRQGLSKNQPIWQAIYFSKMRHLVNSFECFVTNVINDSYEILQDSLDSTEKFSEIETHHQTYINRIMDCLGGEKRNVVLSLINRLFRSISRCCCLAAASTEKHPGFTEYDNISNLLIKMTEKLCEMSETNIIFEKFLLQLNFNYFYTAKKL